MDAKRCDICDQFFVTPTTGPCGAIVKVIAHDVSRTYDICNECKDKIPLSNSIEEDHATILSLLKKAAGH